MTSDELLLHRYSEAGDPAAFRELVDRYAGLVYGISLRVTGDRHMAEDVCQDCFLELARKARMVRENVAGWLHAVATSRSLNVVRSRKRRTRREQAVAGDGVAATESPESRELQSLIDRALSGLSDDLRLPIILHYLEGQSQQEVAERLGINQATVSRRLKRGVQQLRRRLGRFGVITTVAALTSLFGQSSAQAASASLTGSLAKIGLAAIGVTAAKSTPGGLASFLAALGIVAGDVLAFLLLEGWVFLLLMLIEFALFIRPPTWLRELLRAQAFGRDVVADPMWPFRRWTWIIPPAGWKQRLVTSTLMGFVIGLMAFGSLIEPALMPGFIAILGLISALFFTLAARIACRVWIYRENLGRATVAGSIALYRVPHWENVTWGVLCIVMSAGLLLSMPHEARFTLSTKTIYVLVLLLVSAGAFLSALIDWRRSNRNDAAVDDAVSTLDNVNLKPVPQRYHAALTGGCMLLATMCLSHAISRPSHMFGMAIMGLFWGLMLLTRVVKTRNQLPRSAWLGLLAFSVLAVLTGVGLTAGGVWAARRPSEKRAIEFVHIPLPQRPPSFQLSPRHRELVEEYAIEAAVITVPQEKLTAGWYLERYSGSLSYPIPREGPNRKVAIGIGLPDVPELDSVVVLLLRVYRYPFVPGGAGVGGTCAVYAFCCNSPEDARRLNHAWENRGLCKGRLVIFVYGRKGTRAPTSTDHEPIPTLFEHIRKTAPASNGD